MTLRERLLVTGLIVAGSLLVWLGIWQHLRYADAENAIRQYAALEDRVDQAARDRQEARKAGQDASELTEDPAEVLSRQARPELRRSLTRGEFSTVLQRISALQEESGGDDKQHQGQEVSVDAIWPPKSKERGQVKDVLRLLVHKQDQGYDMAPAQEMLLQVADAARTGKKKQAQELFLEVAARVKNAPLRPGFKAPESGGGPGVALPQPDGGDLVITEQQVQRLNQIVNIVLPQALNQPDIQPELRRVLIHAQVVGNAAIAAYRQGKDLRPIAPLLRKIYFEGNKNKNPATAELLLNQAEVLIRNAKPLPGGNPGGPAHPPAMAGVAPGMPAGAAPALPPAGMAPGAGGVTPEALLRTVDRIRKMPEPVYQQLKPQIAMALEQQLAGAAPLTGTRVGVGTAEEVRLDFSQAGEITGVRARGKDLDGGLPAGGLALLLGEGPELPLHSPAKVDKKSVVQRAVSPDGTVTTTYAVDGQTVAIKLRAQRDREGKPGELIVRLPLRAAGWRWQAAGDPQIMAVDGTYAVKRDGEAPLEPVTLRGAGVALKLSAPTAASVSWEPAGSYLVVRLPLGGEKGVTEHTVTLSAE